MNALRPFLSRLLATPIAALVAWLAAKGMEVDEQTAEAFRTTALFLLMGVFQLVYSLVHRTVDKKVNPGDAATTSRAVEEKYIDESTVRLKS